MPIDPISAITTLRALTASLVDSITDRKQASELREIQSIISSLDAEYFRMRKEGLKLETDYAELKQRVIPLETRMAKAEAERDEATAELASLRSKLAEFSAEEERKKTNRLPAESEKMLLELSGIGPRVEITKDRLISHCGFPQARGDYYFDLLCSAKFVRMTHGRMNVGSFWAVTSGGRQYLVENKLI